MFTLCVFISIVVQFLSCGASESSRCLVHQSSFPSNLSESYFDFDLKSKSIPFNLISIKQLSDEDKYKLRCKIPVSRYSRKNYLNKKHLSCKNIAEFTDCIHAFIGNKDQTGSKSTEEKTLETNKSTLETKTNSSSAFRNASVHTLEDLIRNPFANQTNVLVENGTSHDQNLTITTQALQNTTTATTTTILSTLCLDPKTTVHGTGLRLVYPTASSLTNNLGAVRALFNYHDRKKSSIESLPRTNKDTRDKTNQIQLYFRNEQGNPVNFSSDEISTKINIERNPKNNSMKEIMIIEIPIKSPSLRDKNILLDFNEIKDPKISAVKSSPQATMKSLSIKDTEESINKDTLEKDIEQKVEANIIKYLEQFRREILTNINEIIDKKTSEANKKPSYSKSNTCPMKAIDLSRKNKYPKDNRNGPVRADRYRKIVIPSTQDSFKYDSKIGWNNPMLEDVAKSNEKSILDSITTKAKDTTSMKAFDRTDTLQRLMKERTEKTVESFRLPSIPLRNITSNSASNMDTQLITLYDHKHSVSDNLKDIIAIYDIDLKHPKQLILAPKDFLSKLSAVMNNTDIKKAEMNTSKPLTETKMLNTKTLIGSKEKYKTMEFVKNREGHDILENYALKSVFHLPNHCKNLTELCTKWNCYLCAGATTASNDQSITKVK